MMLYFNEYIQNRWFYHENSLEWVFGHFAAQKSLTFTINVNHSLDLTSFKDPCNHDIYLIENNYFLPN